MLVLTRKPGQSLWIGLQEGGCAFDDGGGAICRWADRGDGDKNSRRAGETWDQRGPAIFDLAG